MQGVLWNVRESIRVLGTLPQPSARNVEQMTRDQLAQCISEQLANGLDAMSQGLDASEIHRLVIKEHVKLQAALLSGHWVELLPGKLIFNRFCGEFFGVETDRVREAYADIAMRTKPAVFQDITQILESFSQIATTSAGTAGIAGPGLA